LKPKGGNVEQQGLGLKYHKRLTPHSISKNEGKRIMGFLVIFEKKGNKGKDGSILRESFRVTS